MASQKDRIVIGDTYRIAFQAVRKSADPRVHTKQPVTPLSATVELWDVIAAQQVPLGPSGQVTGDATITDNRIEYLIPASKFEAQGDYKVFVTATFSTSAGTETITNVQQLRVLPKE